MKNSNRFLIARENTEEALPVFIAESGKELSKLLGSSLANLSHSVIDNHLCKGFKVDVVDMSNDLKPNTFEDYIEFCKFEKIKPQRYDSLCAYRESIEKEKALESALTM